MVTARALEVLRESSSALEAEVIHVEQMAASWETVPRDLLGPWGIPLSLRKDMLKLLMVPGAEGRRALQAAWSASGMSRLRLWLLSLNFILDLSVHAGVALGLVMHEATTYEPAAMLNLVQFHGAFTDC